MRGLASILLVFVAAVALISLAGVYNSLKERSLETSSYALELERAYYAKLDFKHSTMQALAVGAKTGETRDEKAQGASKRMAELAQYLKETGNAELWCGIISASESEQLPKKISDAKKPVICKTCWNAAEKAVFIKTFPEKKVWSSFKCLSFIDVDTVAGNVGVSKGGLSFTQDPELEVEQYSGKFAIGVSYYDEITGIGSVSIIPEGTWVGYG